MADKKLNLIIDAKLEGKQQINNTTKSIKKMETQAESSVSRMEKSFRRLGTAIKGALTIAVVKAMTDIVKESEKAAIGFDILRIKNKEVADALERTGEVTFGLADKYDMITSANKALSFGIDLSNGRFEKLAKLSAKTALVMGTDVKSAFDDLITGVSRESKMILDNLGVMVNLNEVYSKYATEIGTTTANLTKQQKQTALLDEVNRQLEKSTAAVTDEMIKQGTKGTAAAKRVETAWKDAKSEISSYAVTVLDTAFTWTASVFGNDKAVNDTIRLKKEVKNLKEETKKLDAELKAMYDDMDSYLAQQYLANIGTVETFRRLGVLFKPVAKQLGSGIQKEVKKATDAAIKERERLKKERIRIWKAEQAELKAELESDFEKRESALSEFFAISEKSASEFTNIDDYKEYLAKRREEYINFFNDETFTTEAIKRATKITQAEKDIDEANKSREAESAKAHKNAMLAIHASAEEEKTRKQKLEEAKRKKQRDEEQKQQLKYYNMLKRFGSEYLNAIVTGQAEMIPQILANQAMMFGQELFWDGLKTFWMGKAKDALFPGLGTSASAVGIAEMGIGAGLMAVGGVANYAMNGGGASTGGAQSQESNQASNQEMYINVNTSLYGSKKEAQRALSGMGVNIRG